MGTTCLKPRQHMLQPRKGLIIQMKTMAHNGTPPVTPTQWTMGSRTMKYCPVQRQSDSSWTEQWLARVHSATDPVIFSPRARGTVDQTIQTTQNFPGEKLMIVSTSIMALDIIDEALYRRCALQTGHFNGNIKNQERGKNPSANSTARTAPKFCC